MNFRGVNTLNAGLTQRVGRKLVRNREINLSSPACTFSLPYLQGRASVAELLHKELFLAGRRRPNHIASNLAALLNSSNHRHNQCELCSSLILETDQWQQLVVRPRSNVCESICAVVVVHLLTWRRSVNEERQHSVDRCFHSNDSEQKRTCRQRCQLAGLPVALAFIRGCQPDGSNESKYGTDGANPRGPVGLAEIVGAPYQDQVRDQESDQQGTEKKRVVKPLDSSFH